MLSWDLQFWTHPYVAAVVNAQASALAVSQEAYGDYPVVPLVACLVDEPFNYGPIKWYDLLLKIQQYT